MISTDQNQEPPKTRLQRWSEKLLKMGMPFLNSAGSVWSSRDRTPSIMLAGTCLFILIFIIWASFAELDRAVRGPGRVVTSLQTQVIQSPDGGIIKRVAVKEGDMVQAGALLVEMDRTQTESQYGQLLQQQLALKVRFERLKAEQTDGKLVFPAELRAGAPGMVAAEQALYEERRRSRDAELGVIQEQLRQKGSELEEAIAQRDSAQKQLALAESEYAVIQSLVERGLEARLSLIASERALNEARARAAVASSAASRGRSSVAEVRQRLEQARSALLRDVGTQLADSVARLAELNENMRGLEDRVQRTELRAPVASRVNKVHLRTIGGVVQAGAPIVELTPVNDIVLVEAEVMLKDIALLHLGQEAAVRVTAYDYVRFGALHGRLSYIGSDALQRPDGTKYFQVRIETTRAYLEHEGQKYPIQPGMEASVDVLVSKRSVMRYLLEPVFKVKERAFRE